MSSFFSSFNYPSFGLLLLILSFSPFFEGRCTSLSSSFFLLSDCSLSLFPRFVFSPRPFFLVCLNSLSFPSFFFRFHPLSLNAAFYFPPPPRAFGGKNGLFCQIPLFAGSHYPTPCLHLLLDIEAPLCSGLWREDLKSSIVYSLRPLVITMAE